MARTLSPTSSTTAVRMSWRESLAALSFHDPLQLPLQLAQKYGDAFYLQLGKERVFFLTHPDAIRELLVVQPERFLKGPGVMRLDRMLGNGLITSEGDVHRHQRKLVQPTFHRHRVSGYATSMVQAAEQKALAWQDNTTLDMVQEMMELTLTIVGKTLFNADVKDAASTVRDALTTAMEAFRKQGMSPLGDLLERLPLPLNARLKRAREHLDAVVYRIIDEHRRSGIDQGDLLSMLLITGKEDGQGMSEQQLRDEVMTLFLAGHETTAHALTWTWYLLAQHPAVLATLQRELDAVLSGRAPTIEDLPRLLYTERVLKESMRLCPPIWSIDRRALCATTIQDVFIPQGARVILSQYTVHHDPRFYPDPDRFDPDRWTPEAQSARPKFAYFPFGGGPRLCIGESFAWTEGILLLATLAQRWELHLVPNQRVQFQPAVTLRPKDPIYMTMHRRAIAALGSPTPSLRPSQ